jgi:hypothetical protein
MSETINIVSKAKKSDIETKRSTRLSCGMNMLAGDNKPDDLPNLAL